MLNRNSESILHPWEHYLTHTKYYHPVGTVGESAKGHVSVLAGQLLQSDDERGESSHSIDTAPWACFICCNEFPGQRRCSVKYCGSEYGCHYVNPQMVVLAEVL